MKALVIWPPDVPLYFNAGHHLPAFVAASHLRKLPFLESVRCIDAGALNFTWKEVGNLLVDEQFDLIAIMNEFAMVDAVSKLVRYARNLSPGSKLITFGRLSHQIPEFFRRYELDAVVHSGDYEASLAAYANWLDNQSSTPFGVSVRLPNGGWSDPPNGLFLNAEDWAWPDIREIPYEAYDRMYLDDSKKFCGIPERRELVVPVARGCPVNCHFCEVPRQQGLKERRRAVTTVLNYIKECFKQEPFEYVSFYAPTFTLKRQWVLELCERLVKMGSPYPWKCVTTLYHLDEEIIKAMAASGCLRISVGLETLDPPAKDILPKMKQIEENLFKEIADWCKDGGIELNCFVILGLPGQTVEGAAFTEDTVRKAGARFRPTIYTPYHDMTAEMDEHTIRSYDRQFSTGTDLVANSIELYRLAFGAESAPTQVMTRIPHRQKD